MRGGFRAAAGEIEVSDALRIEIRKVCKPLGEILMRPSDAAEPVLKQMLRADEIH